MVRSSNGSWLNKRGSHWPKERFWELCFDKKYSINLLDTELRRLEIGTGFNRFLTCRGSPDSKDLWANKHILHSVFAFTCKKGNSISLGVILSVLHLDIFTMILTAVFRIIWRPCVTINKLRKVMNSREKISVHGIWQHLILVNGTSGNMRKHAT